MHTIHVYMLYTSVALNCNCVAVASVQRRSKTLESAVVSFFITRSHCLRSSIFHCRRNSSENLNIWARGAIGLHCHTHTMRMLTHDYASGTAGRDGLHTGNEPIHQWFDSLEWFVTDSDYQRSDTSGNGMRWTASSTISTRFFFLNRPYPFFFFCCASVFRSVMAQSYINSLITSSLSVLNVQGTGPCQTTQWRIQPSFFFFWGGGLGEGAQAREPQNQNSTDLAHYFWGSGRN